MAGLELPPSVESESPYASFQQQVGFEALMMLHENGAAIPRPTETGFYYPLVTPRVDLKTVDPDTCYAARIADVPIMQPIDDPVPAEGDDKNRYRVIDIELGQADSDIDLDNDENFTWRAVATVIIDGNNKDDVIVLGPGHSAPLDAQGIIELDGLLHTIRHDQLHQDAEGVLEESLEFRPFTSRLRSYGRFHPGRAPMEYISEIKSANGPLN